MCCFPKHSASKHLQLLRHKWLLHTVNFYSINMISFPPSPYTLSIHSLCAHSVLKHLIFLVLIQPPAANSRVSLGALALQEAAHGHFQLTLSMLLVIT